MASVRIRNLFVGALGTSSAVILLVSAWLLWPHIRHEVELRRFRAYAGRDLRALDDQDKKAFAKLAQRFVPDQALPTVEQLWSGSFDNWYLWQARDEKNRQRLVLLQCAEPVMIPGSGSARFFVLDSDGTIISELSFRTGNRRYVEDATLERDVDGVLWVTLFTTNVLYRRGDADPQSYALFPGEILIGTNTRYRR